MNKPLEQVLAEVVLWAKQATPEEIKQRLDNIHNTTFREIFAHSNTTE